ncbi:MAG: GNAT family N-acetyltransferase [Clostridia bacterium]|nr:GNAT family N-acetyltransferase [Clostridia bacterium]
MGLLKIRKIILDDLDRVFELMNILYEGKLKYDKFKEIYKLKLQDRNSYYIVATEDENIVGVLTSELQEKLHRERLQLFIEDLIVEEAKRNNGIGRALIENAVNYAKSNNCEVVELTSYKENKKAHKFYENNGFINHSIKFKMYL